jgi:hypothetical protein
MSKPACESWGCHTMHPSIAEGGGAVAVLLRSSLDHGLTRPTKNSHPKHKNNLNAKGPYLAPLSDCFAPAISSNVIV